MAYRRCLLRRANLSDWNKCHPCLTHVLHSNSDDAKHQRPHQNSSSPGISSFIQTRSFGSSLYGSMGFGASSRHNRIMLSNTLLPTSSGYNFCRYMSTANDGSDEIDLVDDFVIETTMDAVASQAPVVDEVAIAAADSILPAKMMQYFIDAVHTYTGLNWWAAIVLTTLLIRCATIPLLIDQLKANSKFTPVRLRMEEINAKMKDKAEDPAAVAEGEKELEKLFKESGVSPFRSLKKVLFIEGPIFFSFFLAIQNMAAKMPSFKHGGAFWFTDLSTPDASYIFPVLIGLSYLITVEYNIQEGSDGALLERSGTMKNLSRALCVLAVSATMGLEKAILCFWLTSNMFSLMFGLAVRVPSVRKTLGIPEIGAATGTTAPESQH